MNMNFTKAIQDLEGKTFINQTEPSLGIFFSLRMLVFPIKLDFKIKWWYTFIEGYFGE